jgi:NADPH-dependent 2,4-dienoyl-CoA reductase/sulfur reductase-like enzyme
MGGQLTKQIHKFFGSSNNYAGIRGIDISKMLLDEIEKNDIIILSNSMVFQIYGNKIGLIQDNSKAKFVEAKKIIMCCGASEKSIVFPGWTLPGVMGAGGVQTLINVYRVLPGRRFLMVGSGNVGLVVAYQILQAGGELVALVEALPRIGGYGVHASKLSRLGVPILTSHTVLEASGVDRVRKAKITRVDDHWNPVLGSEIEVDVDIICMAVGLKPNIELPLTVGCKVIYEPILGGRVPLHNECMETSRKGFYVAGDIAGVEEADTAIEEGRLAGIDVAEKLGYLDLTQSKERKDEIINNLDHLRSGPFGLLRKKAKEELIKKAIRAM